MSAFDVPMACARNMIECINQNHFETPPYGPVPDAAHKLRIAVNNMIDALTIAMAAESNGVAMPPVAVLPEGQALTRTREHDLHREYAARLAEMPPDVGPLQNPEQGPEQGPEQEPGPETPEEGRHGRHANTILPG